jgi:hypothetical protein
MATATPDDGQAQHGERLIRRLLWPEKWSDADKRLLAITFVGGLAANVGLVVVLAVGFFAARAVRWYVRADATTSFAASMVLVAALFAGAMTLGFSKSRRWRIAALVALFLSPIILVLGFIGYAAGLR